MSLTYNPNDPWPLPVLAKFVEVRENNGFHLIYKNGFRWSSDYEETLDKFGPVRSGWTARLFMFRPDMSSKTVIEIKYSNKYRVRGELDVNATKVRLETSGYIPNINGELSPVINPGDVFSIGLRRDGDRYFEIVVNDEVSREQNLGESTEYKDLTFKIWQRSNLILSIHMTNEFGEKLYGLPDYFDIPRSEQPPGSSMIAQLELQDETKNLIFSIYTKENEYIDYGIRKDLSKSSAFYVYVKHLPTYYTMVTSFDPVPRRIEQQQNSARNIWFYRPHTCITLRLTHYVLWDR